MESEACGVFSKTDLPGGPKRGVVIHLLCVFLYKHFYSCLFIVHR
jgi:hypothetical protein